jgi:hypothetical protein
MADLTAAQALGLRLTSLLLRDRPGAARPADVASVVTWFGAMQGQDLASVSWSLGVRLPSFTADDVHAALERREALRTWPMRGTVHLVPARDARWMLDLMGRRVLAGGRARRAELGVDDATATRAVDRLGAALAGGGRLTRAECLATLAEAGIDASGARGYHLLLYAALLGVTCVAPNVGSQQTFALLDEWAPDQARLDPAEALATIALRYLRSHGPTTPHDLAGWTGLTVTDARRGIAAAGAELVEVRVAGTAMWLHRDVLDAYGGRPAVPRADVLTLPGFDEYLLGYKDRALMLADEHKQAIIPGGNGVFQSTLVRSGRVIGIWKRTTRARATVVDLHPLVPLTAPVRSTVEKAFRPYERYLGRPLELRWA